MKQSEENHLILTSVCCSIYLVCALTYFSFSFSLYPFQIIILGIWRKRSLFKVNNLEVLGFSFFVSLCVNVINFQRTHLIQLMWGKDFVLLIILVNCWKVYFFYWMRFIKNITYFWAFYALFFRCKGFHQPKLRVKLLARNRCE